MADAPLSRQPIDGLPGWFCDHRSSVTSTNKLLLEAARDGMQIDRQWLTADEQRGGLGRRGRIWASPPGNMYGSVGLIDPADADRLGTLPLVAALAAHHAISDALPPLMRANVCVKWPNDILIDKAKCAGLLLEAQHIGQASCVVLGFGINCAHAPIDTPYPACALSHHGAHIVPAQLWQQLASAFANYLEIWDRGHNFADIRTQWLAVAAGLGDQITVNLATHSQTGKFETIDDEGFLLLNTGDSCIERISAGDVFFA